MAGTCIFAMRSIPAMEELVQDYGAQPIKRTGAGVAIPAKFVPFLELLSSSHEGGSRPVGLPSLRTLHWHAAPLTEEVEDFPIGQRGVDSNAAG